MGFLDRLRENFADSAPDLAGGVRASATIERIVITNRWVSREGFGAGHDAGYIHPIVAVTFDVTAAGGPGLICERRLEFPGAHIPVPGTKVPVSYAPGLASTTIDVVRGEGRQPATDLWEPPDPSVPRGWSGGIFEVEALGSEGAFPLSGHGIEADRELFRTGARATARVVAFVNNGKTEQTADVCVVKLAVDDRETEVTVWIPASTWPAVGDLIEVAMNSDGSKLALDTDERWDGPPGRALVFKTPPAVDGKPPQPDDPPATADAGPALAADDPGGLLATLDDQLATMKMSRPAMGKHYEKTIRKILDGYKRVGVIDEAGYQERLERALS
jgi:hypothetical protein